jgi:hypothetical protein
VSDEHKLSISSQWARSHSGQDHTGKCSCGNWSQTRGGSHQDYDAILRAAHREHVIAAEFKGKCDLCGEPYDCRTDEVGEFVDHKVGEAASVTAHAQCGLDANLELA